jgi:hypothetical protein
MKALYKFSLIVLAVALFYACDESDQEVEQLDTDFPFRMELDVDEGGTLPDEEDYGLEIKFADWLGDLPDVPITLTYQFKNVEGDFAGVVEIDEVVYKVEIDDCEFERELNFTASTITIAPDPDLDGLVPEEFEVIFVLPGLDETSGGFVFEITGIESSANVEFNLAREFEYVVVDSDLAGSWVMELETEEEFEAFQDIFGPINAQLRELTFAEITGEVKMEFEFVEMKIEIELENPETEEVCEDGEVEEEEIHLEIEAEYDADDGELEMEGSHQLFDDNGLLESEPDFIADAIYSIEGEMLMITFEKVVDEDNFADGEELFSGENSFMFEKD